MIALAIVVVSIMAIALILTNEECPKCGSKDIKYYPYETGKYCNGCYSRIE